MRVLQVNSVCGRGSTGRIAVDIARTVRANGDECTIAWGRDEAIGYDDVLKIGSDLDQKSHAAQTRLLDNHGFASRRATMNLIRSIRHNPYDLVHLHNIHGYYLNVGLLFEYLRRNSTPVVWTLHDCWSFTGHCTYFELAGCDRWLSGCYDCPQKKEYPASLLLDASRKNYLRKREAFTGVENLTLVTPSQWLGSLAKRSFLSEYPVKVVRNEIDRNIFRPTPSDIRTRLGLEDRYIVLFVANIWSDRKGLKFVHDLASHLRADETPVVVGLSPQQISELPPGFVGIERTSSVAELAELYSAADVFVNPTMEDVSSMTNLEAVYCGLPVVCFRTGGAPEVLEGTAHHITPERTTAAMRAGIDLIRESKIHNRDLPNPAQVLPYQAYYQLYREVIGQL